MSAITELRQMTAASESDYKIGDDTFWSDAQLQTILDQRVSDRLIQAPVCRIHTVVEGGGQAVLNGQAGINGTLDAENALIFDSNGTPVSGATIQGDGSIEFDADQTTRSLFLTGLAYDLNGAAADVLTAWAAAVKGGYDVSLDGQSLKRSQRHSQLLSQAETYRSKIAIGAVQMKRSDGRRRR